MKFSIENGFFQSDPSLAAEKQGLGLKCSIENENFKPRMKISSENDFFVRVGMVFSSDRARMNFFDLWALWGCLWNSLARKKAREVILNQEPLNAPFRKKRAVFQWIFIPHGAARCFRPARARPSRLKEGGMADPGERRQAEGKLSIKAVFQWIFKT